MDLLQLSNVRTSVDQRKSVARAFVIGGWMTWQGERLCCGEASHGIFRVSASLPFLCYPTNGRCRTGSVLAGKCRTGSI